MEHSVSRETPESAARFFGTRLSVAESYAEFLAGPGIERGLIGPKEAPRLWDRHILNCAVVASLIGQVRRVADVGSGAGLPGIPVAIARPDLQVILIEPLLRRSEFLQEAVARLGLDNVEVIRSRSEDLRSGDFDVVIARAVAGMDRLVAWTWNLLASGGELHAIKGATVSDELRAAEQALRRLGVAGWRVEQVGHGIVDPPTQVAVVSKL